MVRALANARRPVFLVCGHPAFLLRDDSSSGEQNTGKTFRETQLTVDDLYKIRQGYQRYLNLC